MTSRKDLKNYARQMRHQSSDAENLLWRRLRDRRFSSTKFRRQHPFGIYILDFYCAKYGIAIELDGGHHNQNVQKQYDLARDQYIRAKGITTLRYWNNDVLLRTDEVLDDIWRHLFL